MNNQIPHDAGFTLIEVLIALFVFSVGILGLALMQISAIRGNSVANQVTEATVFGSDQIERMMSWDYNDDKLKSTNDNSAYTLNGTDYTADGNQADSSGRYTAYWDVSDNTPKANSKTIDVTVVWRERAIQKSLRLSIVKPI